MRTNVLVFPCGSEIGLEIYRSLNASTHFTLFGGSSTDDHGSFVYENYIGNIPFVEDKDFIDYINKLIKDKKIDFIIPAHDSVVLKLAEEAALGNLSCKVLTSPLETCKIARSKKDTYAILSELIPTPKIYSDQDVLTEDDFPLFMKPEVGQGSKGTFVANNIREIDFYKSLDPSLLVLEYLPGKEYTIDCFTNKDSKILFCEGRERTRVLNGISVDSSTFIDARFTTLAEKINSRLTLRGMWFFQLKENKDGALVLLEIAPRIAGTMCLIRCKGVNLVILSLFDAMGFDVDIVENDYNLKVDRALQNVYKHDIKYRHVYLDLDDLVVFDGKINTAVMAFVYQCINNNIQVHLITRHKSDLDESLRKYRLDSVFDDIIWVQDDQPKHNFIKEPESIFIDDSFAERKQVKMALGIPVFDSHMLESLMESFRK